MIRKYKTKPDTVTAVQWMGNNKRETYEFLGATVEEGKSIAGHGKYFYMNYANMEDQLMLRKDAGDLPVELGHMIIKNSRGVFSSQDLETFLSEHEDDTQ